METDKQNGKRVDFSSLLAAATQAPTPQDNEDELEVGVELEELSTTESDDDLEGEMSIGDIYKQLTIHEDIILIVDKKDESKIRKGLSAIKAKEIAKLKESNVPHDDVTLEFSKHPPIAGMVEGQLKLQIYLKRKASVKVHKIILPTS